MKITLLAVGKIKESFYRQAIHEFQKRLARYCKLEIIEVADEKTPEHASAAEEIQIKEVSEYDDVSGIDGIMDVDTELESEEKLFAEGFTEETPDDDMTESFADDEL